MRQASAKNEEEEEEEESALCVCVCLCVCVFFGRGWGALPSGHPARRAVAGGSARGLGAPLLPGDTAAPGGSHQPAL
jgi:hypothetical protein